MTTTGPYVVINISNIDIENRIPRANNPTQLYEIKEEAEAEAKRLAMDHSGYLFAVFGFCESYDTEPKLNYHYNFELKTPLPNEPTHEQTSI